MRHFCRALQFLLISSLYHPKFVESFVTTRPFQRKYLVTTQKHTSSLFLAQGDAIEWSLSQQDIQKDTDDEERGNVLIPSGGISVSDEIDESQKDRFVTEVVPIKDLPGVAQLITSIVMKGSFEPVRYLIALSKPNVTTSDQKDWPTMPEGTDFVMVDIPPYSPQLVTRMKSFMGFHNKVTAALITNRDSIHYDEAPSVFTTRRADLDLWKQAFPEMQIIAYRLDIPRDCRSFITQVLDGYGPFALDDSPDRNISFVETGRPLTIVEWDHDIAQDVLSGKRMIPDDEETNGRDNDDEYSPEAIRSREQGKRILAVFTPGHSFGSVSFIFPQLKVCCPGFTIPIEDSRAEENMGIGATGPALDCRGYITTNKAGIKRQMESARKLVQDYSDRFEVILPARGDPLFLDNQNVDERKKELSDIIYQYEKIGQIYEQLGITSNDDDA